MAELTPEEIATLSLIVASAKKARGRKSGKAAATHHSTKSSRGKKAASGKAAPVHHKAASASASAMAMAMALAPMPGKVDLSGGGGAPSDSTRASRVAGTSPLRQSGEGDIIEDKDKDDNDKDKEDEEKKKRNGEGMNEKGEGKSGPKVTMMDRKPRRIVNPLLELPRYPVGSYGPNPIPQELIPNGGEFWNVLELYFPIPDTFPMSYYARLLGYDVPPTATMEEEEEGEVITDDDDDDGDGDGDGDDDKDEKEEEEVVKVNDAKKEGEAKSNDDEKKEKVKEDDQERDEIKNKDSKAKKVGRNGHKREGKLSCPGEGRRCKVSALFDPKTISPLTADDPFLYVPEPGTFSDVVLQRHRHRRRDRTSSIGGDADGDESEGEDVLDYVDPVWETVESNFRGYDERLMTPASLPGAQVRPVSEECIAFAKERGLVGEGSGKVNDNDKESGSGSGGKIKFRFATLSDVDRLDKLNASKRRFQTPADIALALKSPGQYFLLAEEDHKDEEQRTPLGFIHYSFCWYKLGELTERKRERERERESRENASWATSAGTGNIKTPTVSELVLYIDDIQFGVVDAAGNAKGGDDKERMGGSADFESPEAHTEKGAVTGEGSNCETQVAALVETKEPKKAGLGGQSIETNGEQAKLDCCKDNESSETKLDTLPNHEETSKSKITEETEQKPSSDKTDPPKESKLSDDSSKDANIHSNREGDKDGERSPLENSPADTVQEAEVKVVEAVVNDVQSDSNRNDAIDANGAAFESVDSATITEEETEEKRLAEAKTCAVKDASINPSSGIVAKPESAADRKEERIEGAPKVEAIIVPEQEGTRSSEVEVALHDSGAALIITALALEHARSADVLYGMLEVPTSSRRLFTRYFRMKLLSLLPIKPSKSADDPVRSSKKNEVDREDSTSIAMACDLLKCSYRYAFLLKAEEKEGNNLPSKALPGIPKEQVTKERMLVKMPTLKEATLASKGEVESVSKGKSSSTKGDGLFANASTKNRSKIAGVRIEISQDENTETDIKTVSFTDSLVASEDATLNKIASSLSVDLSWSVLRCFSVPSAYPLKEPVVRGFFADKASSEMLAKACECDRVAEELIASQKKLIKLEDALDPKLRSLLDSVYRERIKFESTDSVGRRNAVEADVKEFETVVDRRREADLAWQAQLEQDMDAVCDVCADGEVTVDNQILFCEACNVAVHQKCYGIPKVPEGDYFCRPCRYFKRDSMMATRQYDGGAVPLKVAPSPLPIYCELCPRRQGAFVRSHNPFSGGRKRKSQPKWVHVVCAKWHGLNYTENMLWEELEDVSELKQYYYAKGLRCSLCDGLRGAVNQCRVEGCEKWMHVTCARSSGMCEVVHGESSEGVLTGNTIWTLCCPDHSVLAPEDVPQFSLSLEQLRTAAKAFPSEEPLPKDFEKMNAKERKKYLENSDFEGEFLEILMKRREGARCSICDEYDCGPETPSDESPPNTLIRCSICETVFHKECYGGGIAPDADRNCVCESCQFTTEHKTKAGFEEPQCHMCNQKGGPLKKAFAKPMSMKKWKVQKVAYSRTLFGKQIWCHSVCGIWHPACIFEGDDIGFDCSNVVMASGHSHIESSRRCDLCGRNDRIKQICSQGKCYTCGGKQYSFYFHFSCARQSGLQVKECNNDFFLKCFHHSSCYDVLRARMEDMIEPERARAGNDLAHMNKPMTYAHASVLFHFGEKILASLGWAWKWADWWVLKGDNWEPLIEEGQDEKLMTDEELKKVPSTPESRCKDARRCRLAAFSAALRNRDYDVVPGDDQVALDRALRAILHTQSLVGPLNQKEIDFFAEWLARVYRSNSPLLGFGEDKIPVDPEVCKHIIDGSPKYALGMRPLPGKQTLLLGTVFEANISEVDDFLLEPKINEGPVKQNRKKSVAQEIEGVGSFGDDEQKRKSRGRRGTHKFDEEVAASLDDEEPLANISRKKRQLENIAAVKDEAVKGETCTREKRGQMSPNVTKKDVLEVDHIQTQQVPKIIRRDVQKGLSDDESEAPQSRSDEEKSRPKSSKSTTRGRRGDVSHKKSHDVSIETVAMTGASQTSGHQYVVDENATAIEKSPRKHLKAKSQSIINDTSKTKSGRSLVRKRGRPRRPASSDEDAMPNDEKPTVLKMARPRRLEDVDSVEAPGSVNEEKIPKKKRNRQVEIGTSPPEHTAAAGSQDGRELSTKEELGLK